MTRRCRDDTAPACLKPVSTVTSRLGPVPALAALLLLATGCGGGAGNVPVSKPPVGVSKLHEIPIHRSAVALPDKTGPGREAYHVGLPVNGLANFYTVVARMGDKMGFEALDQQFEWCSGSRQEASPRGFERVWRQSGTNDYLVLQGTEDGAGSVLVIIDDKGDTGRTC